MISRILEKGLRTDANKVAIYDQNDTYTYEQLDSYIGSLAQGMTEKLGLKQHDIIAVMSSNTIESILILYACWRIGVTVTPMNPALKPAEIAFQLKSSQAKSIIYENDYAYKVRETVSNMKNKPSQVIFKGEQVKDEQQFNDLFLKDKYHAKDVSLDTLALLIYTSGTTGKPKGVMLTHQNVLAAIQSFGKFLNLDELDRSYLILPLFHVNSIHLTLSAPLIRGGSVVLTNRFTTDEFLKNVERFKPTYTVGVPTVFKMLAELQDNQINQYDLSSIKYALCGGAPITVSEFEQVQKKFPFKILEAYGLSEATVCSTSNPQDGLQKIGSVGIPLPDQQVKVVNKSGEEVPRNEKGELLIKGNIVMKGYLNNPDQTKEVIRNGWVHTGDLAYQDEDDYVFIVGRIKEMIIRGGINIYPQEIEEVIHEIPTIKEVAIVGIPDEKYGEEVVAYVSLFNKKDIAEDDIIKHCQEKIANYRCPKKIYILDSLPKNSVGKIAKHKL